VEGATEAQFLRNLCAFRALGAVSTPTLPDLLRLPKLSAESRAGLLSSLVMTACAEASCDMEIVLWGILISAFEVAVPKSVSKDVGLQKPEQGLTVSL